MQLRNIIQNAKIMAKDKFGGFGEKPVAAPSTSFDDAIPLSDIETEVVELGYFWEQGQLPPLPIGFHVPKEDGTSFERVDTYSFKEGLDKAEFELMLQKQEENVREGKQTVQKLSSYLVKAIDKIGNYTLPEIEKRYNNTNANALFQRAWLADISTMFLGAKLAITGDTLAISGLQCPCARKKPIYDDPDNGRPLHSINEIPIRYMTNLTNARPVFKLELPKGFNDGNSDVKNLYCRPLQLNDLGAIHDGGKASDTQLIKMLERMVVAIPDSMVFGIKRGSVFTEQVYMKMDSIEDRRALEDIVLKLMVGPVNEIKTYCHQCPEGPPITYQCPWVQATSIFLYSSHRPNIPRD